MQNASLSWLFFSFRGRIRRQTFVLSLVFLLLPMLLCLYQVGISENDSDRQYLWIMLFFGAVLLSAWSLFALCIKRLHDFGAPGFIAIFGLLMGFTVFFLIALSLWPGNAEPNDYGSPPKVKD